MRCFVCTSLFILTALLLVATCEAAEAAAIPAPDRRERVGFPRGYAGDFTLVRRVNKPQANKVAAIYLNPRAASVTDMSGLPYPAGAVIVMEWADPVRAADGTPVADEQGIWKKGEVTRIDVMRREPGFGEAYGDKRSGEWEFANYRPDGSYFEPAEKMISCAACHRKAEACDFVFQARFPALPGL